MVKVLDTHTTADGTHTATARATSPGAATLPFADTYIPDPHGPPSRPRQLALTVVP
ncbi:hypothetical protein [Streptomyces sp. NPDC007205]|uniref:hypothetical protein n=1 Tax=Streptomyces sp. NPDC007205 TaxID=3154316 RepID=UPI0033F0E672